MAFNAIVDPGLYVIFDTARCEGTGALMVLLKNFRKKVAFVADPGHFAHFNYLFKKNCIHAMYFELACNDETGDLPMIEEPPATWMDASKRVAVNGIFQGLSKAPQPVIVLADIHTVMLEIGVRETIGLINLLRGISEIVVVKCDQEVGKELWVVEQVADVIVQVSELSSGFTSEYQGKVRVVRKQQMVKSEVGVFWYKIHNDTFEVIES
jgi:hypothetical protein